MSKYLIVIAGATATGKTETAIRLARHFDTEILNADSRQFYREMGIGTAKPDEEELAAAKHHFVNNLSIHDSYSVGDFERDALKVLEKIFAEKEVAVMAGGSGLFIRAVCEGLDEFPSVSETIRNKREEQFHRDGIEKLQKELAEKDPEYFKKVDIQNPARLVRALSVIDASGKPFSFFLNKKKPARFFNSVFVLLDLPRESLYAKINHRVDLMMENGLLEEARALYPHKDLNSMQTVGYQELMNYFDNEISLEKAVELIKRNSRRYAKRQMTWFRKRAHWTSFSSVQQEEIIRFCEKEMFG